MWINEKNHRIPLFIFPTNDFQAVLQGLMPAGHPYDFPTNDFQAQLQGVMPVAEPCDFSDK